MKDIKAKKNAVKKKGVPAIKKTVAQTIPFIDAYENGMIQIENSRFSKTLEINDISFKTKSNDEQEEIYDNYLKLLNSINAGDDIYFNFINYKEATASSLSGVLPQPTGDKYDMYRNEMATMIKNKVADGRKSIKTRKFATIRADAQSVDDAARKLNDIESEFNNSYKKITKELPKSLDLPERLELINYIMNGNEINPWFEHDQNGKVSIDYKRMAKQNMQLKDIISPECFKFYGNKFQIGERYGQAMYLESVANWMNTNFLAELCETNFESCITLHIEPIPQAVAVKMIHNTSVNVNAEIIQKSNDNKSGYIPTDLRNISKQVEDLQEDLLNRDQKLFYMNIVLMHFAETEKELKEQATVLKNIASKYMCKISPLLMQQERGFTTSLPLGMDKTFSKRLMTTESLGVFIPFDEVNVFDKGGFYYGTNAINKSLIIHNRLKGQNYNGLILGSSGSGKSFSAKREMCNVFLNTNSDIYIIDPDGEYTPIADAFEGSVIRIAPGNGVYINPLDLDIDTSHDTDSNPITMKTDFIYGIVETMIGEGAKLTSTQKAVVGRCIQKIYRPYLEHLAELKPGPDGKKKTIDREYCPTLQNLFDALISQPQPEAQNLALIMEPFVTGAFDTFAHRTNVDLSNRLIVYDIKNIGTNLRELALKVCMNDVWNKMMENRRNDKWTWFYIDEFHLLMNNDSTSEFLKTVWKRARKWQGVPTGITQNVEDLLASSQARAIINNSSFVYMMNQSKMDRDMLAQLIGLTENDIQYITNADIGSGLIYTGKQSIPFKDVFPKNTELYKVMTTKPTDGDNAA